MNKEKVHSVEIYWDGPLSGSADFNGAPHFFDILEDEVESNENYLEYTLIPLTEKIKFKILENRSIWERWTEAFERGDVGYESQPALPHESDKYHSNKAEIDNYLFVNTEKSFKKKGRFIRLTETESPNFSNYAVEWI